MSGQPPSKKWVDYSDSDSSDEPHRKQSQMSSHKSDHKSSPVKKNATKITYPPSRQEINKELDKLDQLDDLRIDEVWVEAFSQNLDYLENEMQYQKGKAKSGGSIVHVFPTKQPTLYELKIYIKTAYQWIQRGYNRQDYIKITVASRNFQRKTRNYSPKHQDEAKKGGFGKEEKKRYVDKKNSKVEDLPKGELQAQKKTLKKEEEKFEEKAEKNKIKKEEKLNYVQLEDKSKKTEPVPKQEIVYQETPVSQKKEDKLAQPKKENDKPVQVRKDQSNQVKKEKETVQVKKKEDKPVEAKKEKDKHIEGKKEKEVKKVKKQIGAKNIKSSNPFDGMLDL